MTGLEVMNIEVLAALEVMVVFAVFSNYISSLIPEGSLVPEEGRKSGEPFSQPAKLFGYYDHKQLPVHVVEYPLVEDSVDSPLVEDSVDYPLVEDSGEREPQKKAAPKKAAPRKALYLTVEKRSLFNQRPVLSH